MDNIVFQALVWQFYDVPLGIMKGWKTFLLFNLNYFSVPTLIGTYLSPWRRYRSDYGQIFEVWKNFETLVFNLMSRIIGAILRTFFIIIGIITEIIIFFIGWMVLFVWVISPIILIAGFIFGFTLLL